MGVVLSQVKRVSEKCSQLNDIVTQLVADVEQHKGTLSQMNTSVDHLSEVVPRYESILEEMNLKIEILEVKSSTGVYIWKVNELGRQYCDAWVGKMTSLYSPPFYTSTHGHRFGYRLCLIWRWIWERYSHFHVHRTDEVQIIMLTWLNMDLSVIGGHLHLHTAKLSAGLCHAFAIILLSTI